MGKHVEFGKDLAVMNELVRSGLRIGVGDAEFWAPLSKPQPALWSFVRLFIKSRSPMQLREPWWPRAGAGDRRLDIPTLDTIDQVVRQGRQEDFGDREWKSLLESRELFRGLVAHLHLSAPYGDLIEVDYDSEPGWDGKPFEFDIDSAVDLHGRRTVLVSTYAPAGECALETEDLRLRLKGWRFANAHELYAFGVDTRSNVRPWAMNDGPIYGPGTRVKNEQAQMWQFPRLWFHNRDGRLQLFGSAPIREFVANGRDRYLIVQE